MRSTSIISIIRRYGISSKRLSPKYKIKYEDAIKGIKAYESSEMKIADVIDNVISPHKSISCHCQLPGCGMKIRYEYVLENKLSHEKLVAGSTCVWPTLGFSELQKKEFRNFEKVIKDHSELIEWSNEHPEVVDKLNRLRNENFTYYRAFWEEIEFCRLNDEDTAFIESVDVDTLIKEREDRKRLREERRKEREAYVKATEEEKKRMDEEYESVLKGLDSLVSAHPENRFFISLKSQVNRGNKLSKRQIACIKNSVNRDWYNNNIKGTKFDIMDKADSMINPILEKNGISFEKNESVLGESLKEAEKLISGLCDRTYSFAWNLYKVKHQLVSC